MRMKKEVTYVCKNNLEVTRGTTRRLTQTRLSFGARPDVRKSEDTRGDERSIGSKGYEEDIPQGQ